jgi:hypothetical protein
MSFSSLFDGTERRKKTRVPGRPLGIISDFVVEEMPQILEEIRSETCAVYALEQTVESMMKDLSRHTLAKCIADMHECELAALDCKMLDAAIVFSGGRVPDQLTTIIDALAEITDMLPVITYEEFVFINPPEDRRTFTCGLTAQMETDFYEGHRIIETFMDKVVNLLWKALNELARKREAGLDTAVSLLHQALDQLRRIHEYIELFGTKLKNEYFEIFRYYSATHPVRKLHGAFMKGASGFFSASIPTADLLLGGENLAADHIESLRHHLPYYPRKGRKDIQRAMNNVAIGCTLNGFYEDLRQPQALGSILQELSHTLRIFRGKHYRVVSIQLPGLFTGEQAGTGGGSKQMLRNRIGIRHINEEQKQDTHI